MSVAAFDAWADGSLERFRGNRFAAKLFTSASALGDFSLIWLLIAATRGLTSDLRANQAFVLFGLIAAESLIVNQGIKRLFRRTRPTEAGDERYRVRRPATSSFPSGHASSAFFSSTVLTYWSGIAWTPAWLVVATIVSLSRVYVRIHHTSDIVAGAVVGVALGAGAIAALQAFS